MKSVTYSRRKWLGLVSPPALAVSFGSGLAGKRSAAAGAGDPKAGDLGARIYNVRDFGARGDGAALDTAPVQAAIDACTRDGGGTVLVPAGTFLIGTIELKSNVTLHLAAAGKLLGSADGKHYHAIESIPLFGDSTLGDGHWALVFAVEAANATVEGPGTIDGQGVNFHAPVRGAVPPSGLGGNKRPYLLLFHRCTNLTVRDIDLLRSGYHCIRVIESSRIQLHGIYIHNRVSGNNDGFHFISAEHVAISNCTVKSQDDACALFGSCKFVTITNCSFSTRWSVFRFGGGIAENISVSNCLLYQVFGCPIKLEAHPGARFENISFSNLVLQEVTGPINISAGSFGRRNGAAGASSSERSRSLLPRDPGPGIVRNVTFSNIHGTVTTHPPQLPDFPFPISYNPGELRSAIVLNCVGKSMIENVSFNDVHLTFGGGGTAEDGARRNLPELAQEYFSLGPIPAFGLYARNTRGLTLCNVRFQVASPELRPAVVFDRVEDAALDRLSVEGNPGAESVVRFTAAKRVLLTAPRLLTRASTFLSLEGPANEAIEIEGGDLTKSVSRLALKDGAARSAVRLRT